MDFTGKIVLVTGGSRGIGAAISRAFSDRGAIIGINYRENHERAKQFISTLKGKDHELFAADIATPSQCKDLITSVVERYGRIDILINNAGIHEAHPIDSTDYSNWDRIFHETMEVNLFGPARLMFLAAYQMKKQGEGRIVNISSRGAFRGEPDQPAYGASKAGLNQLSQSLAQKLIPWKIFIGVVAPGFVETELAQEILDGARGEGIRMQSPFGRVAKPEEVAYAVLFLASSGAEFSTGAIIDVNGASYLRT